MYKKLFIFLFFVLLMYYNGTNAQVTIGSMRQPLAGALLDLKQDNETTKGLGLPRVVLSSINELKMGDRTILDTNNAYNEHIGLLVYNITSNRVFCPGIYVWTGAQWEPLHPIAKPDDITVNDVDGNTYTAKWFSKDPCDVSAGKYWTTSNMYATKSADGNSLPLPPSPHSGLVRLNPAYRNSTSTPAIVNTAIIINNRADLETGTTITYEEGLQNTSLSAIALTRLNFAKKFGLLYTQEQAKKVCPTGWHLPTDSDWIDLLKVLDEDGEISNNPSSTSGNNDVAQKMRASSHWYKSVDQSAVFWGEEDDANVVRSGFDAYPSGDVEGYVGLNGTSAVNFSSDAYWWSASTSGEGKPYTWYMILNDKALHRVDWYANSYYFSVRCVK